jgi:hypothetical protein
MQGGESADLGGSIFEQENSVDIGNINKETASLY